MTRVATPERRRLLDGLADAILAIRTPHPARVAIDGVDAAGKTTLADELGEIIGHRGREVIRATVDRFANPATVRRQRGVASAEGYFHDSFDYQSLTAFLLRPLGPGGSRRYRRESFDIMRDAPIEAPKQVAAADAVLLLDGVFLHRPELDGWFEYSIYVRAGFDVTVARAEHRDLSNWGSRQAVRDRYEQRYVPGQRLYLASVDPESKASVVIDNNDPSLPSVVPRAGPR